MCVCYFCTKHFISVALSGSVLSLIQKIPGDGREFCVCSSTAVKIRAEDGRNVSEVDISPFISNLPFGKKTDCFASPDASGSTSQATNIMEVSCIPTRLIIVLLSSIRCNLRVTLSCSGARNGSKDASN